MNEDERIPVVFAPRDAAGPDAPPPAIEGVAAFVLAWADPPAPEGVMAERMLPRPAAHGAACVCCTPRAALAEALHRLFVRRARGDGAFFSHVVVHARLAQGAPGQHVSGQGAQDALADPLVASRFRAT